VRDEYIWDVHLTLDWVEGEDEDKDGGVDIFC